MRKYLMEVIIGLVVAAVLFFSIAAGYQEMLFVYQGF